MVRCVVHQRRLFICPFLPFIWGSTVQKVVKNVGSWFTCQDILRRPLPSKSETRRALALGEDIPMVGLNRAGSL